MSTPTQTDTQARVTAALNWSHQQIGAFEAEPLRVEASHRLFFRLVGATGTVVLMVSPPELENNASFVALTELLALHGVGVPQLIARDDQLGAFLLTDLGKVHLADVYSSPDEAAAVQLALDGIQIVQTVPQQQLQPYTTERLLMELGIFTEWFIRGLLVDAELTEPELTHIQHDMDATAAHLVPAIDQGPKACVHRDYHSRNLLLTQDGALGVVDYQDALWGPACYDVASLLYDCYHEFDDQQVAAYAEYFRSRSSLFTAFTGPEFAQSLATTALQRQIKAIGIFARLYLRDKKTSHLPHILPNLRRARTLAHTIGADQLGHLLEVCTNHAAQLSVLQVLPQ
ncbi:MAG: phosphotransferase [Pseudomonadota bacterium]